MAIYPAGIRIGGLRKRRNTATEALAGEWKVTVDAVDEGGNVIAEDFNGIGHILMNTYNTAANTPTEMYVDDIGHFWEYKVRVKSDINALTCYDTSRNTGGQYCLLYLIQRR